MNYFLSTAAEGFVLSHAPLRNNKHLNVPFQSTRLRRGKDKSELQGLTPSSWDRACGIRRGVWGRALILSVMSNEAPNTKWIKDLNVRPETIKLLEENIGKTLSDINHSRILYDPLTRVMEIKAKINKWDLIKLKSFCTMKETISKVKRQTSEWEKIIANEATDKELT